MLCKNCKAQISEKARFCENCGAEVEIQNNIVSDKVNNANEKIITADQLPEHLRPISPWGYFGLQLLYSIPIVGLVFLIIFSFKKSNINRRNFTRSYWCSLIIIAAIVIIVLILSAVIGFGFSFGARTPKYLY